MIGQYTLELLCNKYGISAEKIVKKNNNILDYGEYQEIDKTLNYLINELKIAPINIEKCPSILYRNVEAIKHNVEFLKKMEVHFSNIESCLHVLTDEPSKLKETYNYVIENYGINKINRNTSILSVNIDIIKSVEKLNLPISKEGILTIAVAIEYGNTNIDEIQKIIQSPEFKEHPELFTSQTLAHAKLDEIQKIIRSPEFKEHPEMFTSTTLAHAKLDAIQKIIQSPEFKEHPELFSSQTLAHAKLEDIQKLLGMDYWKDERFKDLLTSSIVAKSKSMISKLPITIQIAELYSLDRYLSTNFLLASPSQNYAKIQYLKESNLPLEINGKLNPIFGVQPGVLKKKYNIDINKLIIKYPLNIDEIKNIDGGKKL